MRLKVSVATANENLVSLINLGYSVLNTIQQDYTEKKNAKTYNEDVDNLEYERQINQWANEVVVDALMNIFPTELEKNLFLNPEIPFGAVSGDYKYKSMILNFRHYIRGLETVRHNSLSQYTDLPMQDRLYVEDIDSFQKVRDVNPAMVAKFIKNGFLSWAEDQVQMAFEQILGVSFHKKDWGGEINDLYTANVIVNNTRRATGFLLKGPSIGKKEMVISDCGKNGDQLVRLFSTPADLFVIQYVGPISEMVISDVRGKIASLKSEGKTAHYLIIDGQDTARLLHAYGKLS